MEYILIVIITITILLILLYILEVSIKKLKKLSNNPELNKLTSNFPNNIEIAKSILKKLNNEKVQVEENKEGSASLYIVQSNKIIISNIKENYMRIQTIAHECLHSIQSKKMQWFNFIYTNIYGLYTILIIVLTIFRVIENPLIYLTILIVLSNIHYFIRSMLENEAMIKAKYLAKEYIEENKLCTHDELNILMDQYEKMNEIGIKLVNFDILSKDMIKIIIYSLICIVVLH